MEVRVLPDASTKGRTLEAKPANSKSADPGSSPGVPASSRKVGHGQAEQSRKLSEREDAPVGSTPTPSAFRSDERGMMNDELEEA